MFYFFEALLLKCFIMPFHNKAASRYKVCIQNVAIVGFFKFCFSGGSLCKLFHSFCSWMSNIHELGRQSYGTHSLTPSLTHSILINLFIKLELSNFLLLPLLSIVFVPECSVVLRIATLTETVFVEKLHTSHEISHWKNNFEINTCICYLPAGRSV